MNTFTIVTEQKGKTKMVKNKSVIHLNGKQYNLTSARQLGHSFTVNDLPNAEKPLKPKRQPPTHNRLAHHHPQKAQTLMRRGLEKPRAFSKRRISSASTPQPIANHVISHIDLERAQAVPKSSLVSRFSGFQEPSFTKRSEHLPVAQPSEALFLGHHPTDAVRIPTRPNHHQPKKLSSTQPSTHDRARRIKSISAVSVSLVVILAVALVASQNIVSLQVRNASAQAGFSAHVPYYQPAGYSQDGPIAAEPGKVSVSFRSKNSGSIFRLTQIPSSWNSDTLLNNYLLSGHKSYQARETQGTTVYITDNSAATWIYKGIRYQIEGNAHLTSDQFVKIASSLQ